MEHVMAQGPDVKKIRGLIEAKASGAVIPDSVYRLQFCSQFQFRQGREIAAYLSALGVESVYASPFFQASPGSTHGYDVTNPARINDEIGSEKEFEKYCETLKKYGLGQILDIVPNHMGITGAHNLWWLDVLENGPSSAYAKFFDIDWEPDKRELKNKVLIPILGGQYGNILEKGELRLHYERGTFFVNYWDNRFPVSPETYSDILLAEIPQRKKKETAAPQDFEALNRLAESFSALPGPDSDDPAKIRQRRLDKETLKKKLDELVRKSGPVKKFIDDILSFFNGSSDNPASFDFLDRLLNRQSYRLSYWRVAAHEINYRRFFHINSLAAIRMEDAEVFDSYHRLVFSLLRQKKAQGLRIDHPDGLYDPTAYFRRIQQQYLVHTIEEEWMQQVTQHEQWALDGNLKTFIEENIRNGSPSFRPLYIVVEKILDRKETLPQDWEVHGTVGYGFLNNLNGLFVNRENENLFGEIYEKFIGHRIDFEQLVYEKKKLFAAFYMSSEVNHLGHRLDQLSERDRRFRDFTLTDLITAIREVIACFPVYRTYISPDAAEVSERDQKYIHIAIEKAKGKHPALSKTLFDYIRNVLLLKSETDAREADKPLFREFVLKFQQLTAPIMAKGLEDTAFYIYNRLLSLNEVGGDPEHFGVPKGDFHRLMGEKQKNWPAGMLATSTHDSKRSEDVRMRLNVLSEIPKEWNLAISRWTRLNEKYKSLVGKELSPARNTEYMIYQTLLGAWPDESFKRGDPYDAFRERLWGVIEKSLREAKIDTNWLNPNEEYEAAVKKFLAAILSREKENKFLKSFRAFQRKISLFGKWNSLSALAVKLASPGVVDTYQGNEIWNYCLVDPDNRHPVDYKKRMKLFSKMQKIFHGKEIREEDIVRLLKQKTDGMIKMYFLWRGLMLRKRLPGFFLNADYVPLEVRGEKQDHVIAFLRKKDKRYALACAVRFFSKLYGFDQKVPASGDIWKDTRVLIPRELREEKLLDIFSGQKMLPQEEGDALSVPVTELFRVLNAGIYTNLEECGS